MNNDPPTWIIVALAIGVIAWVVYVWTVPRK